MDDRTSAGRTKRRPSTHWASCPHVNRNDIRCANRFSLGRVEQAYAICFGSYRGCPMYHRINREMQKNKREPYSPIVQVTANGTALPLRPTGT